MLDEKAAAAQALGIYAAETREAFAPHIEEALATLVAMANYFHDDVRPQSSISGMSKTMFDPPLMLGPRAHVMHFAKLLRLIKQCAQPRVTPSVICGIRWLMLISSGWQAWI